MQPPQPRPPIYRQPSMQQPSIPKAKFLTRKKLLILGILLILIILAATAFFALRGNQAPSQTKTPTQGHGTTAGDGFNTKSYSLTSPTSIWVIVNKPNALNPLTYVPPDLVVPSVPLRVPGNESMQVRKVAASALEQLVAGAKADGISLMLASGYRSYTYQVGLYNGYVKTQGQASADQTSARPGHSEHQTGLAADLEPINKSCELDTCFGQLAEGKWLAANAYKYGFIIRYPVDKVAITGYQYEPWHIRYVGVDLATEMHKTGVETLEEFFNVKGGDAYN